jgi:hypothetical protein
VRGGNGAEEAVQAGRVETSSAASRPPTSANGGATTIKSFVRSTSRMMYSYGDT